jgi:hypothetical protein
MGSGTMGWPQTLQINAYAGDGRSDASSITGAEAQLWPLRGGPPRRPTYLRPSKPVDLSDWQSENVGWGIVAAEPPGASSEVLTSGSDLPEPIQQLRKDRGNAPVFRFRQGWKKRYTLLRNWASQVDLEIGRSPLGLGRESIPYYLMIYGGPERVPWELQYQLNHSYAVGRLHVTDESLGNYVGALRSGWRDAAVNPKATVIWSTDHGPSDITALMRDVIGKKLHESFLSDVDLQSDCHFFDGHGHATTANLLAALKATLPALIITTSHGQTYPLDDPRAMAASLGFLVDQDYHSLGPTDLDGWNPNGAIWYAHACCSAGASEYSQFEGLCGPGSQIDNVMKRVAEVGNCVAPLPSALLGSKKPLRAFIGHVEPTFDWTLMNPDTRQALTDSIRQAMYNELYQPSPVGRALRRWHDQLAALGGTYQANLTEFERGGNTGESMLRTKLVSCDVQSTVLLGDPTAILPTR